MSTTDVKARWGRTQHAEQRSGLKRGKLYQIAHEHHGLLKKAGAATLWDLDLLDEILADLPDALAGERTTTE
jgi:hypothetical protein